MILKMPVNCLLFLGFSLISMDIFGEIDKDTIFHSCMTGPVRAQLIPDFMVEDFSRNNLQFRSINGVTVSAKEVDVANPIGSKSLLVDLPATGFRGKRGIEINLPIPKEKTNWSKFNVLEFWLTYPENSSLDKGNEGGVTSRIDFTVLDGKGEWFTQVLKVRPYLGGRWQPLEVKFNDRWQNKNKKRPDFSNIRRIQLFVGAHNKSDINFSMSGIGLLFIDQNVPSVSIQAREQGFLFKTGEDFKIQVQLDRLPSEDQANVLIEGRDFHGKKLWGKEIKFDRKSGVKQEQELSFPNPSPGYVDLSAVLSINGKKVFQAFRGLASLPTITAEQETYRKTSIFSIWPWHISSVLGVGYTRKFLCVPPNYSDIESGLWQTPSPPDGNLGIACVGPPLFWNKGWLNQSYTKEQYEKFAKKLEAAVKKIKPGLIPYYEVINEPNAKYWGPMETLVDYHKLVYEAIKKGDPKAKIGGPCPYCIDLEYMENFFKAGGTKYIDFVDIHGYNNEADFQQKLQGLKTLMAKYGIGDYEIIITEKGDTIPSVTPEEQAGSLVRAYVIALAEGVKIMIWHALFNDISRPGDRPVNNNEPDFNVLRADGSANPAFVAYGIMTRTLLGAKFIKPMEGIPDSCAGYEFASPEGRKILVIWKKQGGVEKVSLPVAGASYWQDIMGGRNSLKENNGNTVSFSITKNPSYVIW